MRTVSQVVEEIVLRSPLLAESLAEGIANSAQVARTIKPEVEKRLLEKVSEGSIAMALHRLGKKKSRVRYGGTLLKRMNDLTVRSNLVEFVYANAGILPDVLETVSKSARARKDTFFNFSRGVHESLIIVSAEFEPQVAGALKGVRHVRRLDELSAITMRLPEESLAVPGVYYPILKALADAGISFVEVLSVRTELSLIFEDKDVDRAFSILKRITS